MHGQSACRIPYMYMYMYMLFHWMDFLYGAELEYNRTVCTGITMPVTSLCGDQSIIHIVTMYQYDFDGEEDPGRPCVYSERDCGKAIRRDDTLYLTVLEHCDGHTTCGGFYIRSAPVCSGRYGDYMIIRFQCTGGAQSDTTESAAATATSASTVQRIETTGASTDTTYPSLVTSSGQSVSSSDVTVPESGRSTLSGSMSTSSSDEYDERAETLKNIGLISGLTVAALAVVGIIIAVVVVNIKRKRQKPRPALTSPSDMNVAPTESAVSSVATVSRGVMADSNMAEGATKEDSIPVGASYCNVATPSSTDAAYSEVHVSKAPAEAAYSNLSLVVSSPGAVYSNVALGASGDGGYYNIGDTAHTLMRDVPNTVLDYPEAMSPGSSEYEALESGQIVQTPYVSLATGR